ncbi:MAG: response regulator [Armatimonadetes bacterium]|nr:response regulator [Armatimonadota bacterium]
MAESVLIIEDYSTHRVLLHRVVTDMGCRAIDAADGRAGLAEARAQLPSLICLDLVLPDIDGVEVLRRLKRDAATAHIPVLIVSAVDRTERLIEALAEGAEDYVTKPYNVPVLQARMRVLLRAARLGRQLAEDAAKSRAVASIAQAGSLGGDLAEAATRVAGAMREAAGVDRLHLFVRYGDRLLGPCCDDRPVPRESALADVLHDAQAAGITLDNTGWQRRSGSRMGLLGRGLEHLESAVVALWHGADVAGMVVVANETGALTEPALRLLGELAESAALVLSAAAERAMRAQSENRYRVLFEQAGDGVAIIDPATGLCRQVNQALAAWLSAMPRALEGVAFRDLFAGGSREAVGQGLLSLTNGRPLTLSDQHLKRVDGDDLLVEMSLRRVRQATGSEVVAVIRDVSSRTTAGLYQHAHEDLDTLAMTVRALNHSINNPLTCIIGLTQLLQLRLRDLPDHQPTLETILSSAHKITDLTRQLREVAVALGGEQPMEGVEEILTRLEGGISGHC